MWIRLRRGIRSRVNIALTVGTAPPYKQEADRVQAVLYTNSRSGTRSVYRETAFDSGWLGVSGVIFGDRDLESLTEILPCRIGS